MLEARRAVYDDFRGEARAAALGLREDPSYPALLKRLVAEARAALGPDAEVERDPEGAGGVRARSGARSVDLTLPALVEGCVARLGDRVTELWR